MEEEERKKEEGSRDRQQAIDDEEGTTTSPFFLPGFEFSRLFSPLNDVFAVYYSREFGREEFSAAIISHERVACFSSLPPLLPFS